MSKRRIRLAARLAAKEFGVSQRVARRVLEFWVDAGSINPQAPIEELAKTAAAHVKAEGGYELTGSTLRWMRADDPDVDPVALHAASVLL